MLRSPLQSPLGNAAIAEIVLEAKLALSAALEHSASGKVSSSATAEGWSAVFLQLEEETLNILTSSLDSSDFFARMTAASCPSGKDAQMDTEDKSTTGLPPESPENKAKESRSQQLEAVEATSNGAEEPVTSPKEEEVTTVCTNEVISQIFDAYKSADLEEERLRAAKEIEEEVSLLTSHVVDNVMIQLKELTSSGKPEAFHWVPRDVRLPAPWALCAAGQIVFSQQFEMAAEEKVSEVLILSEAMTGETPVGSVYSTATEIVGSLVRGLSNLSLSVESFRSAENGVDTTGTAQNIYHSVQNKVRDFLWGKKPSKQEHSNSQVSDGSVSYDTESYDGTTGEKEEEDDKEETSVENETSEEDLRLPLSKDGRPSSWGWSRESRMNAKHPLPQVTLSRSKEGSSPGQKTQRRKADPELNVTNMNQYPGQTTPASRTPQPAGHSMGHSLFVGYLLRLVCCIHADDQVKDEDLSNVTQAETSTSHISKSHVSDIIVIMQRETSSSDISVDSTPGIKSGVELYPGEASQCPENSLLASGSTQSVTHMPHIDRNTTKDCLRKLMCCSKADDHIKAEDVTEAKTYVYNMSEPETSSVHSLSESHMSDIILIMGRERTSPESLIGYK